MSVTILEEVFADKLVANEATISVADIGTLSYDGTGFSQDFTINGTLTVNDAVFVNGVINQQSSSGSNYLGNSQMNNLTVTNALTVNGSQSFDNLTLQSASIGGNLTVNGNATIDDCTIANCTVQNNETVQNNLVVNGTLEAQGRITQTSTETNIFDNATISNLTVTGEAVLNSVFTTNPITVDQIVTSAAIKQTSLPPTEFNEFANTIIDGVTVTNGVIANSASFATFTTNSLTANQNITSQNFNGTTGYLGATTAISLEVTGNVTGTLNIPGTFSCSQNTNLNTLNCNTINMSANSTLNMSDNAYIFQTGSGSNALKSTNIAGDLTCAGQTTLTSLGSGIKFGDGSVQTTAYAPQTNPVKVFQLNANKTLTTAQQLILTTEPLQGGATGKYYEVYYQLEFQNTQNTPRIVFIDVYTGQSLQLTLGSTQWNSISSVLHFYVAPNSEFNQPALYLRQDAGSDVTVISGAASFMQYTEIGPLTTVLQ